MTTKASPPKRPGRPPTRQPAGKRPRSNPAGAELTMSDRAAAWRADLKRQGGKKVEVNLLPHEVRALERLAKRGERGPLIARLILEEHGRQVEAGALPDVDLRALKPASRR